MNTQPLFEVSEIWPKRAKIFVHLTFHDDTQQIVKLDRKEFETWLDESKKLELTEDIYDQERTDVIGEKKTKISIFNYWKDCAEYHATDVYDFILLTRVGFGNLMKGVYDSIQEICKDYQPF